jgi:acyl carrier protein
MSEQGDRLVRCFASAFPTLSEGEIRASNAASWFDFDSLAGVTLVALIDQEFGVNIDLSDLLELRSFERIEQFLRERNPSSVRLHEREAE